MRNSLRSRQPPAQWRFNDTDLARDSRKPDGDGRFPHFWRCPVRLVDSGRWKLLWQPVLLPKGRAKRRAGAVTSVLPVLAAHTFVGKTSAGIPSRDPDWSGWHYLSRRKVAALAGVNKDTVTEAFRHLKALKLLEERDAPWYGNANPSRALEYRLKKSFYPSSGETYVELPLALFYSGLWAALRTPAIRQLYITIACLDPILNEDAFPLTDAQIAAHGGRDAALHVIREEHNMSVSRLAHVAGLQPNTVRRGLRELTRQRLVSKSGHRVSVMRFNMRPSEDARPWYAMNREAFTIPWYRLPSERSLLLASVGLEPDNPGSMSRTRVRNEPDVNRVCRVSA
jgi:DNA-binding transcriptional regulator YhcF (GntR family)